MKKVISLVIAVLMVLSTAVVASALSYNGFTYRTTLSYDEMIITGYTGSEAEITVPSEINSIPVTIINTDAFQYNKTIKKVKLPSSIKEIGDKAFMYCSNLSEFDFNGAKATIGINSFYGCTRLLTFKNFDSVTEINSCGIDNTAWLNNQDDGIVYFGKALYKYEGTMPENTTIAVKSGTVSISPDAFIKQTNLVGITFPESLKTVGYRAFCGCTSLMRVTALSHITSIGTAAFGFNEVRVGTSISYPKIDGFVLKVEENSAAQTYAVNGGISYEFITAEPVPIEKLSFDSFIIHWQTGNGGILPIGIKPTNATNKKLTWKSTNKKVIDFDENGNVIANSVGIALVSCKTTDGSNIKKICLVIVNPGKPENVKAEKTAEDTVTITWSEAGNARGYDVYRSTSLDGDYDKIGTTKTTSFTDDDAQSGVKYYYKVKAYGRKFIIKYYGTMSNPASVTM